MVNKKQLKNFKYLYGPVSSWRLGSSLGVDPISKDKKICSFDCVYCQIGATSIKTDRREIFVPTAEIIKEMKILPRDLRIDYITLSGMGEPTLAANLGEIIRKIRTLRKEKISVITNSSLMWDESVRKDLSLADFVMAKLDAYDQESFEKINRPVEGFGFEKIYAGIKSFKKENKTKLAIQIMFFEQNKDEVKRLAELAFKIDPDEIQINTPLRPCKVEPLSKDQIADIKKYFLRYAGDIRSKARIVSVYNGKPRKVQSINRKDTLRRRGKTS